MRERLEKLEGLLQETERRQTETLAAILAQLGAAPGASSPSAARAAAATAQRGAAAGARPRRCRALPQSWEKMEPQRTVFGAAHYSLENGSVQFRTVYHC